jgi:hypothetical protein
MICFHFPHRRHLPLRYTTAASQEQMKTIDSNDTLTCTRSRTEVLADYVTGTRVLQVEIKDEKQVSGCSAGTCLHLAVRCAVAEWPP